MKKMSAAAATVALTLALVVFSGAALAGGGHDGGQDRGYGSGDSPSQSRDDHDRGSHLGSQSSRHDSSDTPAAKQTGYDEHASKSLRHESKSSRHEWKRAVHASESRKHESKPAVAVLPRRTTESKAHFGAHEKVYICHSTGSATNAYVLIHVSKNALRAHTRHHDGDDLVLGESVGAGCPQPTSIATSTTAPTTTAPVAAACTRTVVVEVPGYVLHHTGSEKHPFVKIHPSSHSAHYSKHADDVVVAATTRKVEAPAACNAQAATTTTTVAAPTTSTVAATTTTTTTTAGGVAGTSTTPRGGALPVANTTPTGGVLGAQATLPQKSSSGGVLGTVTGATLPFTGLPLLPVVLAAFAAIALGIGFRRAQRGV